VGSECSGKEEEVKWHTFIDILELTKINLSISVLVLIRNIIEHIHQQKEILYGIT